MTPNSRIIARRVSISISLVALVIAIALYIIQQQISLAVQIGLGIFIIGLAAYVALDPSSIRSAFTGRQAKYGSNALVLVIAFVGILVVVNYLAYKNTKQWDLTEDQSNTLAKETVDVLKSVPETVVAKAFYSSDSQLTNAKDSTQALLEKYVYAGNGKFQYEFIDPNKNPSAAQDAGISTDGTIVLYMGNQKQSVPSSTESDVTGAIVRLMNPGAHVVYFLTGHGEFPIDDGSDQSYTELKTTLEARNYKVASLNLLTTGQIPQDANVIVIAGPDQPLSTEEVSLLDEYLKNGGSVVVMENPGIITNFGTDVDPLADYLSSTYGIILGNDVVVDVTGNQVYQNAFFVIGTPSGDHVITNPISSLVTGFNYARSVSISGSIGTDFTKTELVFTADQSWGETDVASLQDGSAKYDAEVDTIGPVSLAVSTQGSSMDERLVVFGNSDFATNAGFGWYGNGDLIVNSIDWAAKAENLISLTPKQTVNRTLVQPQGYTMGLILLASLIVLPGVVIVAGVSAWLIRRKQG
jgi:ABC-type uncharacterized transport system involved in gliding motility auxiliary subunit